MTKCRHLDSVRVLEVPEDVAGCEECLEIGSRSWIHLRMCVTCGKVGCCDSSPNRHASKHAAAEGHPVMRSAQPGEIWGWCTVDEVTLYVTPDGMQETRP